MDFEELYDNLDVELHNLSIRLTKNVFHSEANNQVMSLSMILRG